MLTSLLIAISIVCCGLCDAGLVFVRDNADSVYDSVGICDKDGDRIIALYNAPEREIVQKYGLEYLANGIYRSSSEDAAKYYADHRQNVKYIENDCLRNISVENSLPDPAQNPYEYVALELNKAHEFTKGENSVKIAVLDTGVDRSDAAVKNALLAEGYDTATDGPVTSDTTGHGTAICSLIYTVAPDCVIMPLKVSRGTSSVYTSDLIKALYYAADNGAKVINMSFGGYNYSYAEQEAVDYCVSKGCILIAAAGNDGMTSLADSLNYPAGYDGVIGVGSIGKNGAESEFSQEVGADVLAPGEMITVKSGGTVSAQNGTSYSAAFISGTAALCASICSECRFESAEFEFLISLSGDTAPSTAKFVELSLYPAVTGVKDGGEYTSDVYIYFNHGTAYLDGEEIDDGERVFIKGTHTLTVSHLGRTVTVNFKLASAEAEYKKEISDGVLRIMFDNDTAFLDGSPYRSGDAITVSGEHYFEIISGGVTRAETFVIDAGNMLFGVKDGTEYAYPIAISVCGTAYLDGEMITGEVFVGAGEHTIDLGDKTVSFKINDHRNVFAALGDSVVFGNSGMLATFKKGIGGVMLYDIGDLSKPVRFISTAEVDGCVFAYQMLAVLAKNLITFYNTSDGSVIFETVMPAECDAIAVCDAGICCICDDKLYIINRDGTANNAIELGIGYADCALACGGNIAAVYNKNSDDGVLLICDLISKHTYSINTGASQLDKDLYLFDSYVACGRYVFDIFDGSSVLETDCGDIIASTDGVLICRDGAADINTGATLCKYSNTVRFAGVLGKTLVLCQADNTVAVPLDSSNAFGGYAVNGTAYQTAGNSVYFKDTVTSSAVYGDSVLFTLKNDRNIYMLSKDLLTAKYRTVPFIPNAVYTDGTDVYVSLKGKNTLMRIGETDSVISVPADVTAMAFCGGKTFMLCDGVLCELSGDGFVVSHGYTVGAIAASQYGLLAASRRYVKLFDTATLDEIYSVKCREIAVRITVGGEFASAGGTVFEIKSGTALAADVGNAKCFMNGMLFTDSGIFKYGIDGITSVSSYSTSADGVYVCGDEMLYVFKDRIQIHDVAELLMPEPISGIIDGGVYYNDAEIIVNVGTAYLDEKITEGSVTVYDGGTHVLKVHIAPGVTLTYEFSVVPALAGIEFADGDIALGIGEECALKVLFLPFGAQAEKIIFESSDESILTVDEHGTVYAVSSGVATVTAYTADRTFNCRCEIKVLEDPIRFVPQSGIIVDRILSVAYRVPLGTTATEFLKLTDSRGEAVITAPDGTVYDGILKTGMRIELYHDGVLHDALVISVSGDIDGDGYSTFDDYMRLSDIISSQYGPSVAERYAADINADGILSSADLLRLRGQLLFSRSFYGSSTPPPIEGDGLEIAVSRFGDTTDVLISCKNTPKHFNGRLMFDSDLLEFVEVVAPYAQVEYKVTEKYVSFIVQPDFVCGTAIMLIRFRSLADGATVSLADCTVMYGAAYSNAEITAETDNAQNGISVINALRDICFDKDVYEYTVTLPKGSISAMISAPADAVISDMFVNAGESFDITVLTGGRQYTLHCNISNTLLPDGNSLLKSISVDGYKLMPDFDPLKTEYSVRLKGGEIPHITAEAESVYAAVEITFDGNTANVICTAEDKTVTVYTVTFISDGDQTVSKSQSDDSVSVPDNEPAQNTYLSKVLIIASAVAALIIALIAAMLIINKNKK